MDNKDGQWDGLAPRQAVQCPGAGQGWAGCPGCRRAAGPFIMFLQCRVCQTSVAVDRPQPQAGPPGPRARPSLHVLGWRRKWGWPSKQHA